MNVTEINPERNNDVRPAKAKEILEAMVAVYGATTQFDKRVALSLLLRLVCEGMPLEASQFLRDVIVQRFDAIDQADFFHMKGQTTGQDGGR